jgi:hypothetical protein
VLRRRARFCRHRFRNGFAVELGVVADYNIGFVKTSEKFGAREADRERSGAVNADAPRRPRRGVYVLTPVPTLVPLDQSWKASP